MRLRQVLLNFLGNAIKFSAQGRIEVRASRGRPGCQTVVLRLEVSDQGIGIGVEEQARLFRAFSQVDESSTRRYGGTGLGLVISRRIAELMGGDVGVAASPAKAAASGPPSDWARRRTWQGRCRRAGRGAGARPASRLCRPPRAGGGRRSAEPGSGHLPGGERRAGPATGRDRRRGGRARRARRLRCGADGRAHAADERARRHARDTQATPGKARSRSSP
jgi:signal transduction histidine kinase